MFCVGTRRIPLGYQRASVGASEFVRLSRHGRGRAASDGREHVPRAPKPSVFQEVWHDEWRGYASLAYDHEQTVVHTEEFVTDEGVHINHVECLWSLFNPWLAKFRGLSRPGLEHSAERCGTISSRL